MARPHFSRKTMVALLLLGAATAVLASLGRWQLQRADERRTVRAAIEAGRASAPLMLSAHTPARELVPWRPARVQGSWLPQASVLLENRNQGGRPGYWLATPLQLDAASRRAILVLRGWLPRTMDGGLPALPATAPGLQEVRGELAARVPRLFELWSAGASQAGGQPDSRSAGSPPVMQNLDLSDYARGTGLDLLPAVLMQTQGADALVRDWPQPSVDAARNVGYALQWFAFAAIAAGAWLAVALRAWRRRDTISGQP